MASLEDALFRLADFLDGVKIPYMIIGGMAVAVWGEPRATIDLDVTIWVEEEGIDGAIEHFQKAYSILVDDPPHFVRKTRALPLANPEGIRIDVIFGLLLYEREAIERAVPRSIGSHSIRFCSPEDLILHKIISSRTRDLEDARSILRRRKDRLDLDYLSPKIEELTAALEDPSILSRFQLWLDEGINLLLLNGEILVDIESSLLLLPDYPVNFPVRILPVMGYAATRSVKD